MPYVHLVPSSKRKSEICQTHGTDSADRRWRQRRFLHNLKFLRWPAMKAAKPRGGPPSIFGRRVKQLLDEKEMSVDALARAVGLSSAAIYSLLSGRTQFPQTQRVAKNIANHLGVDVEYLHSKTAPRRASPGTTVRKMDPTRKIYRSEKYTPSIFGRRLSQLIDERAETDPDFNETKVAKLLGLPGQQTINNITTGRSQFPRGELGSQLADLFDVDLNWLYNESAPRRAATNTAAMHQDEQPTAQSTVSDDLSGDGDLPVYTAVEAGTGEMVISSDPIDHVQRPWYVRGIRGAYAVVVVGDSMEPRYSAGEIAIVNPREILQRGKDVIVTGDRNGDFKAMIKTYIGQTANKWRLKQYNPAFDQSIEFEISKEEWPHAVRVVGRYDD